jgi:hypothetical protein
VPFPVRHYRDWHDAHAAFVLMTVELPIGHADVALAVAPVK